MSTEKANSALKETPAAGDGYRHDHPARATDVRIVDAARGIVTGTRKKIAVCGFASSSRGEIPVDDPTWEVWGLNQLYRHIARADRWFDIHWNWDQETVPGTDYRGWLRTCGIPFYMVERQPDLPTSVTFPLEDLIARWGDYFTSTIAFMLALALDEITQRVNDQLCAEAATFTGPEQFLRRQNDLYGEYTVGIWGVDLVVGEEYFWQKACAEFWVGALSMRGVRVYVPGASALCKARYRYGYEPEPQEIILPSELTRHMRQLEDSKTQLLRELYLHDGALQADEHWKQLMELRLRGARVDPR